MVLASFLCNNGGKTLTTAECNGMACTKMVNIVLCSSAHLMLLGCMLGRGQHEEDVELWSCQRVLKGGKGAKCSTNVCGGVFLPGFAATVLPGAYALVL